jgi:hypothetical protein
LNSCWVYGNDDGGGSWEWTLGILGVLHYLENLRRQIHDTATPNDKP